MCYESILAPSQCFSGLTAARLLFNITLGLSSESRRGGMRNMDIVSLNVSTSCFASGNTYISGNVVTRGLWSNPWVLSVNPESGTDIWALNRFLDLYSFIMGFRCNSEKSFFRCSISGGAVRWSSKFSAFFRLSWGLVRSRITWTRRQEARLIVHDVKLLPLDRQRPGSRGQSTTKVDDCGSKL